MQLKIKFQQFWFFFLYLYVYIGKTIICSCHFTLATCHTWEDISVECICVIEKLFAAACKSRAENASDLNEVK